MLLVENYFFAKGVILVEGDAEEYLVPILAKLLGYDLDELGSQSALFPGPTLFLTSSCSVIVGLGFHSQLSQTKIHKAMNSH